MLRATVHGLAEIISLGLFVALIIVVGAIISGG